MYSSETNDIVLDPFLGSGQIAVVSKMLNRQYIGFEIVKKYYEFAQKRLEKNIYRIKKDADEESPALLDLFKASRVR
jgi:site-specific DNA-methyltransferase (adenine-specific)